MSFDALYAPSVIGGKTLSNRIVLAPRSLRLSPTALATWFSRRTGAGLCIVPGTAAHFTGKLHSNDTVFQGAYVETLAGVARIIQAQGARAVMQLTHAGAAADHPFALSASRLWNPNTERWAHRTPKLLLPRIFHSFGQCAYHAVHDAGFDGIEIDGGGLSLANTFFSSAINHRRDAWGRDRTRFGIELVERVRAYLGPTPILAFRLSLMDFDPEGPGWNEILTYAHALENAGVNCFSFAFGLHSEQIPVHCALTPEETWIPVIEQISGELRSPVIYQGPFGDPAQTHALLLRRPGDLIELDQEVTAEPNWPVRIRANDSVRTCLRCRGGCPTFHSHTGLPACPLDPEGFIPDWNNPIPMATTEEVLVIGGGPAGMAAARTARLRGARVRLVEQRTKLGGGLTAAARQPGQKHWENLANTMAEELKAMGVEILLSTRVDGPWLAQYRNHARVVLAVGSKPIIPDIPGLDSPNVLTYEDLMIDGAPVGNRVVILGDTPPGRSAATYLVSSHNNISRDAWLRAWGIGNPVHHAGGMLGFVPHLAPPQRNVVLLSEQHSPASSDPLRNLQTYELQWLRMNGVQTLSDIVCDSIDPFALRATVMDEQPHQEIFKVDHIILAVGCEPRTEVANALQALGIPFEWVGSQVIPKDAWCASKAFLNGFKSAMLL